MATCLLSMSPPPPKLQPPRPEAVPENEPRPEPDRHGGDVDFEFVVSRLPGYKGPGLFEQLQRVKKRGGAA
jgi:hypothetical protein